MNFKDVDEAFARLIIDEDRGITQGVPRMKYVDQTIDIAYLKGKFRLQCRTFLYTLMTDESNVDLRKEDFSEASALLDRKKEYLGIDPALFLFYRLLSFLAIPKTEMSVEKLLEYINLYDLHAKNCDHQERIELLSILTAYSVYLSNRNLLEDSLNSILLAIRLVHLEYRISDLSGVKKHLNSSTFKIITVNGPLLIPHQYLVKVNYVIDWPEEKTNFKKQEWFREFSRIYAPHLDPKVKKQYVDFQRASGCFYEGEYFEASKIFENIRFPDDAFLSMTSVRMLYYCAFSLYYHGTPAERKVVHRKKMTPKLVLDRFRKRLDYQVKKLGDSWHFYQANKSLLNNMQAIQKSYDLVNGSTPPKNVRETVQAYLLPIRQTIAEGRRLVEIQWMQTQIELLEKELERLGL